MNITYNEMKQQYIALRKTFNYLLSKRDEIIGFFEDTPHKSLTYTGCGSSYMLCQSAQMSANVRLGILSTAIAAGELMLHNKDYSMMLDKTMIIAISRSGSTSEVIKAIEAIREDKKTPVLSITCVENSHLEKISDFTLKLNWAYDESVCQTRTIVNFYTANLLIAAFLSGDLALEKAIDEAIDSGDSFMAEYEELIAPISEENWTNVVILADGEMKGIAAEGALAMTEIAQIPGNYYNVLDVRHGPMVLVNKDTLVIACLNENGYGYQKALIKDIIARGAKTITFSSSLVEPIEGVRLHISSHIKMDNAVSGIPFIFIPQVIAVYRALKDGINPDNPEGLTAWVKI